MIPESKCGLSAETQNKIRAVLARYSQIKRILLYGSRAKGNFKPGSDIDLTLDAPEMKLSDILKIENELDDLLLPYKIDLCLFHQIDNKDLTDHIHRVGLEL